METNQPQNDFTDEPFDGGRSDLRGQTIVLVHGLASSRILMKPLDWRLQRLGYRTRNWGYPSILYNIERHGQRLVELLKRLDADPDVERLHLVTHSMGCIVGRYALHQFRPEKAQRVVMLAPPNKGSHVATFLSRYLGRICTPLDQLRDTEGSFVRRLQGLERMEVGIISASRDFMVPFDSTQVDWQMDHTMVSAMHTGLLFRRATAEHVHQFLQSGRFASERPDSCSTSAD